MSTFPVAFLFSVKFSLKASFFERFDLFYGNPFFYEINPVGNLHQSPVIVGIRVKDVYGSITVEFFVAPDFIVFKVQVGESAAVEIHF